MIFKLQSIYQNKISLSQYINSILQSVFIITIMRKMFDFSEPESNNSSEALYSFTSCVLGSCRWIDHLLNIIDIIFPVHWKAAVERLLCFLNQHAGDYKFVREVMQEKTLHGFFTNFVDPVWNFFFIPHHTLQNCLACLRNTLVYFFGWPGRIIITFFCHFYNFKF